MPSDGVVPLGVELLVSEFHGLYLLIANLDLGGVGIGAQAGVDLQGGSRRSDRSRPGGWFIERWNGTSWPIVCGCGHRFSGSEERVDDPVVHQQWELPPIRPLIFQYDLVRLRCPCCRRPRLAQLPVGVSWSPFAPRLQAHIGVLAGVYRLSRRQVREVVCEIFGVPISTGAVDASMMRMSEVLADPWERLRASIQAACQVHADETGWRLRGAYECMWVATTALAACYRIDPTRSQNAAKELLGEEFGRFVICDRYVGYHWLDVLQQQLCWAHAIRQLVGVSERGGAPGKLGRKLLRPRAP